MIDAIRAHAGHLSAATGESTPAPRATARLSRSAERPIADDSLLVAARRDIAAFAPLYDRYLGPIFRYCLVRLGTVESAEDATAHIFTKALDALATCRDAHFRSWLFAIARNVVIDTHRASRPLDPLDAALGIPDPARHPTTWPSARTAPSPSTPCSPTSPPTNATSSSSASPASPALRSPAP